MQYQDDLDPYEADVVMVDEVPVVVKRYESIEKNEYAVFVYSAREVEQGKDPWAVSDSFLSALRVGRDKVVWENEELKRLLGKEASNRTAEVKPAKKVLSETAKVKKTGENADHEISDRQEGVSDSKGRDAWCKSGRQQCCFQGASREEISGCNSCQ